MFKIQNSFKLTKTLDESIVFSACFMVNSEDMGAFSLAKKFTLSLVELNPLPHNPDF